MKNSLRSKFLSFTQTLKSVKGPWSTFDLIPKWERTLSFEIFRGVFIEPHTTSTKKIQMNTPRKISNDKVLSHLGIRSKVDHGPLTDLSVCVNFCTSSRYCLGREGGRGSKHILWKIPNGKVLAHLRFKSNVLPWPSIDLSAWMDFCTSSSSWILLPALSSHLQ
jgi:hypothetical protein